MYLPLLFTKKPHGADFKNNCQYALPKHAIAVQWHRFMLKCYFKPRRQEQSQREEAFTEKIQKYRLLQKKSCISFLTR